MKDKIELANQIAATITPDRRLMGAGLAVLFDGAQFLAAIAVPDWTNCDLDHFPHDSAVLLRFDDDTGDKHGGFRLRVIEPAAPAHAARL